MTGFFLALIHLAYHMYIDADINVHLDISYAERGKRRAELLNTKIRKSNEKISTAVQRIFDEHLAPHARIHLKTFVVKDALGTEKVLTILGRYHDALLKVKRRRERRSI